MANAVQLIGLREANAALKKLPQFAKDRAQKEMDTTAFHVSRRAQEKAPVRAVGGGTLKRSIRWASRPRSVSAVVGVGPDAWYWKFLEYGTVKMGARPFMRPAAESMDKDHESRLLRALERAADDVERAQGPVVSGRLV